MTRPAKHSEDRRGAVLRLRVTLAEKQQVKQHAAEAGLSLSDWVRIKLVGAKPLLRKPNPDREALLRLLAALGRAGNNINQIARQMNRKQQNDEFEIPLQVIAYSLQELRTLMQQLRDILDHVTESKDSR